MNLQDTVLALYGNNTNNRKAGHGHFLTKGVDATGSFTEASPAVIHCRGDAAFTAAAEAFIQANPEATFPGLVQLAVANTLANQQRGTRLFYAVDAATVAAGKAFYGQLMGSTTAAVRLVESILEGLMRSRLISGLGPYTNGRTGLFNSSAAQVAAEAFGEVSYEGKGTRRLSAGKVSLPRSSVVARGTSAAASRRPLAKPAIRDDESIMAMVTGTVLVIATDVIYRMALASNVSNKSPDTLALSAAKLYGSHLVSFILSRGLNAKLMAEFDRIDSVADSALRAMLVDSFWTRTVGVRTAPTADFNGMLDGFTNWLAEAAVSTLKASREQQLEAGAAVQSVVHRVRFSGAFGSTGARWVVNVVDAEKKQLRSAIADQLNRIERTRKGLSLNSPIPVPALPLTGECGGQLAAVPSKGRTNWLIKHSVKGIPQQRQADAAAGLAMDAANAMAKGANHAVATTANNMQRRSRALATIDAYRFKV